MHRSQTLVLCLLVTILFTSCTAPPPSDSAARDAMGDMVGGLVVIDCHSGRTLTHGPEFVQRPLPPCSTFKIVNALIGLETGVLAQADQPFYQWDGVERFVPAWNRDLTLREAFAVSCVPAFQNLARQIGPQRMQQWIDRIGYGNGDLSAGIDVFWLPAKGRQTLLITPMEQAAWMRRVAVGDVPFSAHAQAELKKLMLVLETPRGRLYGKTGSGTLEPGETGLGWFVGYVQGEGRTYAFACVGEGQGVMGKDARAVVEAFFKSRGSL
jgi:beta-lactamase class D